MEKVMMYKVTSHDALVRFVFIGLLLATLWTPVLLGEEAERTEKESTAEQDPPKQENVPRNPTRKSAFVFHGFLSQAYAVTDGEPFLGITEDGTTNYRNIAIQFRYMLGEENEFVVQLSHERLGASPVNQLKDDIELDWAFYRHQFTDTTSIRIGRIPLPIGIYNEIRDVGTVLPFFSAPFNWYGESSFNYEAVDGIALRHLVAPEKSWNLELDLYYGEWTFNESDVARGLVRQARAKDGIGGRIWVNSPISGVRFGGGGYTFQATDGLYRVDDEDRWEAVFFSFDATLDRVFIRAEWKNTTLPVQLAPVILDAEAYAFHGQIGWQATPKLGITAQYQEGCAELEAKFPITFSAEVPMDEIALGLAYAFAPNLVMKGEYHMVDTTQLDRPVNFIGGESAEVDFSILSLAVSF